MKSFTNPLSFLLFLCIFLSNAVAEENEEWIFNVTVDGNPIGEHRFKKTFLGEKTVIESEARFDVKILFVNVLKYRHQNTEVWESGCLSEIESATRSNRKEFKVSGRRNEESFSINTLDKDTIHQGCLYTFAYWNPDFLLQNKLINAQTGEMEEVTITKIDTESDSLTGYLINAKGGPIKVWYADETWIGLESTLKNGRTLSYQVAI
ncbi:MAG: hypothetical protein CMQ39_06115 [Gammaproteobacteria bacterium]|nr:hypothetical protein [Gammaproteobacteria bacterium]|tara:strand:+ start:640 stop:1260 length:621 start_codon:yes stop_codon:yes gene_type:complete